MRKYISIFLLLISIFLISLSIFISNKNIKVHKIEINKISNYTINLKPNPFYQNTTKGIFPSNAIKSFNINFLYQLNNDIKEKISYTTIYKEELITTFTNQNGTEKEIWKKKNFVNKNNKTITKKKYLINKNICIDYDYYKNLVKSYEDTYNISTNAYVKLELSITYKINSLNKKIKDEIEFIIPLKDKIVEVTKTKSTKKTYKRTISTSKNISFILLSLGSILLIISTTTLIKIYNKQKKNTLKRLNNFLKDYKELIVYVKNIPNLNNYQTFFLENFKDLLDVALQNHLNIIYYKDNNHFYCFTNSIAYIYIFSL